MSALGEMIIDYEKQIEILTTALEQIASMPLKNDKPYELIDAVHIACETLKNIKRK